ncbi:MAG: alpha/beta hydrolase-fold protein [Planctomycetota bacterium]
MLAANRRPHPLVVVLVFTLAPILIRGQDRLAAGQEGPLAIPGSSAPGILYLPTDYRPGARLPLIFFMHGSGGKPTSWPWRTATGGRGHIIVGLPYGVQADAGANGIHRDPATVEKMVTFIDAVRKQIDDTYGIDRDHVILSGLSMGGWGVNFYGFVEAARERYVGYAIIAAGPQPGGTVDLSVAAGHPVLLLNGEEDANLAAANAGRPALEKAGALVEQVILPGQGHVPSTESMAPPLRDWLAKVKAAAERKRGLEAVAWRPVRPEGDLPRSTREADLSAYFPTASWLPASGRPTLIFAESRGRDAKERPSRAALASAKAEAELFLFPRSCEIAAAARAFDCLRLDLSALDPPGAGAFAEAAAPTVFLLDAERHLVAVLGKSRLRAAGLQSAMLGVLGEKEREAALALAAELAPRLDELEEVEKDLAKAEAALARLRGAKRPSEKAIDAKVEEVGALEARRAELVAALRPPEPAK